MDDLVARLRNTTFLQVSHPHFAPIAEAAHEAADEIEALRKDAERYRHVWDNWPLTFGEMLQSGYGVYPIENKAQGDAAIDAALGAA